MKSPVKSGCVILSWRWFWVILVSTKAQIISVAISLTIVQSSIYERVEYSVLFNSDSHLVVFIFKLNPSVYYMSYSVSDTLSSVFFKFAVSLVLSLCFYDLKNTLTREYFSSFSSLCLWLFRELLKYGALQIVPLKIISTILLGFFSWWN